MKIFLLSLLFGVSIAQADIVINNQTTSQKEIVIQSAPTQTAPDEDHFTQGIDISNQPSLQLSPIEKFNRDLKSLDAVLQNKAREPYFTRATLDPQETHTVSVFATAAWLHADKNTQATITQLLHDLWHSIDGSVDATINIVMPK